MLKYRDHKNTKNVKLGLKCKDFDNRQGKVMLMNVGTAFLVTLLSVVAAFPAEDYSQWHYYRPVTVNTTASGANVSGTLQNFPVLVRLNPNNFDFSKAAATGGDIRFAKTNGTHLPYQIERWDTVMKAAEIWVLVDTVIGNSNNAFRMYLGKSGVADSSKGGVVFDTANGFQGVFHLAEATNDTVRDATVNRFKGVPRNRGGQNPLDTVGAVGKAKNFLGHNFDQNGGSYRLLTSTGGNTHDNNPLNFQNDSATRNGISQFTISAWIYMDAFPTGTNVLKGIVSKSAGLNARQYHLRLQDPGPNPRDILLDTNRLEFNDGAGVIYRSGTYRLNTGNWYHVAAVRNGFVGTGGSLKLYLDGGRVVENLNSLTQTTRSDYDVYIGSYSNDSGYFSGKIDEVEFSNVARDSNWILLACETQKPGSSAVMVGSEVPVGLTHAENPLSSKNTVGSWVIQVNGSKTFSFQLPKNNVGSAARMTVENMDGRVVWNKEFQMDEGGLIFWNGFDNNGLTVAPGMYVVRIITE